MKISIAIPVYECHGKGWLYLAELLNSIIKQNEKDIEVVISDQSTDDAIEKLCNFYKLFLNIKYINSKNTERSNSVNSNNAIKNCSSEIIKIMCGDDFFIDDNAINKILNSFEDTSINWLVNSTMHCDNIHALFRPFTPVYDDNTILTQNTISGPSVLTFRNKFYFDEKLIMLMDCDMYKHLYNKFGNPYIIKDYLTCNRNHSNQMQHIHQNKLANEEEYCIIKYRQKTMIHNIKKEG